MPPGTRDWQLAITGLMDCSIDLEPVFAHSPFTATSIPFKAQHQFIHSVLPLLQVIRQTEMGSDLHQRLIALFYALPHLLLRVGSKDSQTVVASKILSATTAFQHGHWAALVARSSPRPARPTQSARPSLMDLDDKVTMAQKCIQAGSLRKARTVLTSNGMASGDPQEIIDDLHRRNPASKGCYSLSQYPPTNPDQSFSFSRMEFHDVLLSSPPQKARDQWGWRIREHFLPLLKDQECGDLLVALIFVPIANGHFSFFDPARAAGGKLFALSKAPKKGVRPIVVTDAVRAVVGKLLYSQDGYRDSLNDYFTNTHPRVMQMGVGLHNGASIMQHLICALLGAATPSSCGDELRRAVVTVDVKNAFNEVSRATIFDTICNRRGTYGTELFQCAWPFLRTFYGSPGQLRYETNDGSIHTISSEEGTHQGDVWSPALFAASIHPTVCQVLDDFPDVVAVLWADNIFFVGPLLQAASAARRLRDDFRPLGLALNDDETKAYVPGSPDIQSLQQVLTGLSDFPIQPVLDGIKVLGVPFGVPSYVQLELARIVSKIEVDMPKIAGLRDGLMHFQMLRFCENTRFAHVTRALPPDHVSRPATQVDKIIMSAFEAYCGWPEMPDSAHAPKYAAAREVVRGALGEGGFGLTAVADTCYPAFYHAAAHSLQWICNRQSLVDILGWDTSLPPRQLHNNFVDDFLDVEEHLLTSGCKRPDDVSIRPTGATALLPAWKDLISPRSDGTFYPLPPQRVVVRTFLTCVRSFPAPDHASQFPCMCNRKLQTIRDHASSPLKDMLGFSQQQLQSASISYNPMAFLMSIPVTKWQLFPKHLFQRWVRLALDLPFDECASTCEFCGQTQDESGHHRATCSKAASKAWTRGHNHVVEAIAAILDTSGLPYTTKEASIPRHADSSKRGDILVQCKLGRFEDLVLDFSLTHPRSGASKLHPIGDWKPDALDRTRKAKDKKHAISYEQGNHAFLSLVADTYGKISDDFVRFVWMVATAASTNSRLSQPPSDGAPAESPDSFAVRRGAFFSRMRVQLGAAIAKAAAARFITDGADDGLPIHVFGERKAPARASPLSDLPLYHAPC
jgi:hypothetical protein